MAFEVLQASLTVERGQARDVVRALLGTILFQRILGNVKPRSVDVGGVSFVLPADAELEREIAAKVDAVSRALDQSPRSCRLVVAFYPTPASPPSPQPKSRPRPSATPPTMTSAAHGWFSASTKALALVAGPVDDRDDESEHDYGSIWEAWVIDVEMVAEGRRGVAEEKLRSQLNDFLLRTIMFVTEKTAHVPPVTSADQIPFGFQILVNPSSLSFTIPKAVIQAPVAFPLLHRALVNNSRHDESPGASGRSSDRYAATAAYGR